MHTITSICGHEFIRISNNIPKVENSNAQVKIKYVAQNILYYTKKDNHGIQNEKGNLKICYGDGRKRDEQPSW